MSERQPDFDFDRERGQRGEDWTADFRRKIAFGSAEVKTDEGAIKYGNLFFEYRCRSKETSRYEPSGLSTTKADVWVHIVGDGNPDTSVALVISVPLARKLAKRGELKECERGGNPTKGLAVPLDKVFKWLIEEAN